MEYADFWRRLGGYIIDYILIAIVVFIASAALSAMILSTAPDVAFTQEQADEQDQAELTAGLAGGGVSLVLGLGYYITLNANGGTLGKRFLGMRLQRQDTGADIGYGAATGRYVVAIFSGLALLLGYLWCIWDEKKQTWHDKAVGSVVVVK